MRTTQVKADGLTMGVDTGTSACKTVVVNHEGRVVASASRSYPTRRGTDGEVSQDPQDWLRAASSTIRACLDEVDARALQAVGVTAPAHVAVLLDRSGVPLSRSLLCFDARPRETANHLRAEAGDAFYETTYAELTEAWTFAQLVWLRRELGARLWDRLECVLMQKDFLRYAMTGVHATDISDAVGAALVNQASGSWDSALLAEASLSEGRVPPIEVATTVAGHVTSGWARRSGLLKGTPVVVGATDTVADLVSVGACSPGDGIAKIASTGALIAVCASPRPHRQLLTYPMGLDGLWYSAAVTNTAATAYNWARRLLGRNAEFDARPHARLEAAVRKVPPGSEGLLFLPFLEGERVPYWDRRLRGAFLGLTSAHTTTHLVRAVMEGVALSLRDCRQLMESHGLALERPFFTGGGVESQTWRGILAALLERAGTIAKPNGPAVGAAVLARRALGDSRPYSGSRQRVVRAPDGWSGFYDQLYRIYVEAAGQVQGISHALGELSRRG